jgi:hypothetical protein
LQKNAPCFSLKIKKTFLKILFDQALEYIAPRKNQKFFSRKISRKAEIVFKVTLFALK